LALKITPFWFFVKINTTLGFWQKHPAKHCILANLFDFARIICHDERQMMILGIESSCDDTGVAIYDSAYWRIVFLVKKSMINTGA
jgi:type IV secretory pathway VirB3-like protein